MDNAHSPQERAGTAATSPPPRRADAVRNEAVILDSAMRVLAERPAASMAEIAQASGLGRATLYRHFPSRGDLVQAIQRRALEAGAAALADSRLGQGTAVEALERAIAALVGVGDRYRVLAAQAELDPELMPKQAAVAGPLLDVIRRGQRARELRRGLKPEWILAAMAGLLVLALRQLGAGLLSTEEAALNVSTTLLGGVAEA